MRSARKLMLLAIAAIAAMAVFAPTASATDTVEVVNEKTGTHCATSGANLCTVHAIGVATLRIDLGVFGEAHEATCDLETVMTVGETGSGSISQVNSSTGAGQEVGCPTVTTECNLPWPASGEEDGPTGVVQSNATVCIDPAESGSNCVGNLAFDIAEIANEDYEVRFTNASVGLCELDVVLTMEYAQASNAQIHVNHP